MTRAEREEVFDVFYRVGDRMGVRGLPTDYTSWEVMRREHLAHDLVYSPYTDDLFKQYRKHLGGFRYTLLREAQRLVVPTRVTDLLGGRRVSLLWPLLLGYKLARQLRLGGVMKWLILPPAYRQEIGALDRAPG